MWSRFPSSIGLGRWGRVAVRLHVYFVAFAMATLYLCWPAPSPGAAGLPPLWAAAGDMRAIAAAALAVLLCSVWWHELAHWWVARYYGLASDVIVLGPLGGLTPWGSAARAGVELSIWSAGPVANLAVVFACRVWLSVRGGADAFTTGWNPLRPDCFGADEGGLVQGVQLVLWVNWLLFLLNVLPAYPFDGGRIARAAARSWRPAWSSDRLDRWVDATAVVVAGLLLVAALELWRRQGADVLFPSWLPLLLLGVLTLIGARHSTVNAATTTIPNDLSARSGDNAGHRPDTPRIVRRSRRCHPAAAPPESAVSNKVPENSRGLPPDKLDADDERLIDAILSRVHAHGMQSLSAQERVVLERASARYRSRLGKQT